MQFHSQICTQRRKQTFTQYMHTNVYSNNIYNGQRWEQHKGSSTDKWINKMRYRLKMEYYSE